MWLTKKKNQGGKGYKSHRVHSNSNSIVLSFSSKKEHTCGFHCNAPFFINTGNLWCCTQISCLFSTNSYIFMWDRTYPTTRVRTLATPITLSLHLFLQFSNFQLLQLPYQYQFSIASLCTSSFICLSIGPQLLSKLPKYQPHTSTNFPCSPPKNSHCTHSSIHTATFFLL